MHARQAATELFALLPRLALMSVVAFGLAFAVSKTNAVPHAFAGDTVLVGGQMAKPSGVGFVLAVGLQRG